MTANGTSGARWSKKLVNHLGAMKRFICPYNLTRAAAESEPDMDSTTLALPYGVYRLEDLAEKGIGIGHVEPLHDEYQVAFWLDPGHVPTSAQGVVA